MESEPKQTEKKFMLECINLYRDLPALWNVKSKEYRIRDKKIAAYEKMLKKYRQLFPKATKEDIRKKFNSLRTNYRKECKKQAIALKMGKVHTPTLWYFDAFAFLQELKETESQSGLERCPSTESSEDENEVRYEYLDVSCLEDDNSNHSEDQRPSTSFEIPKPIIKKRSSDQYIEPSKRLRQDPDEYELWALSCAADLKKMDPLQQIFAKNAISSILMEGQLGLLHRHSVKINEPKSE